MTGGAPRCPVCDDPLPAHGRPRGGRKARYCSAACKAKAYRDRQQADEHPPAAPEALPPGACHARAVEIRQQVSELAGILADTASGQQSLFATPGATRSVRPVEAGRTLHRLITELTLLATAATVTKRATKRRAPPEATETPLLFHQSGPRGNDLP
ncbi:MAG: hypothetical protein ACRDOI_12945 [Trebonia sp.]